MKLIRLDDWFFCIVGFFFYVVGWWINSLRGVDILVKAHYYITFYHTWS